MEGQLKNGAGQRKARGPRLTRDEYQPNCANKEAKPKRNVREAVGGAGEVSLFEPDDGESLSGVDRMSGARLAGGRGAAHLEEAVAG